MATTPRTMTPEELRKFRLMYPGETPIQKKVPIQREVPVQRKSGLPFDPVKARADQAAGVTGSPYAGSNAGSTLAEGVRQMFPSAVAAERERVRQIEEAPTVGIKINRSFAGIPRVLSGAVSDVFSPYVKPIASSAAEAVTGKPVEELTRKYDDVMGKEPQSTVPQSEPTTPAQEKFRPKIGLPQDFVGKAGGFDVSREGDVQVIRGPGSPSEQATISPLEAAKYQLDAARTKSQIAADTREEQMAVRELIKNSPELGDIAPSAYRIAQESSQLTGLDLPYVLSLMEELGQNIDPKLNPIDKATLLQAALQKRLNQEYE